VTASKYSLYNGALRRCGERKLETVTDEVPARYYLDAIWDEDPIQLMLELYFWKFARRVMEWNYNASYAPAFGRRYVFDQPDDYVRMVQISADENFSAPLRAYEVSNGFWHIDFETIYICYVSNDQNYGYDYSKWPKLFEQLVASYMAKELSIAINKSATDITELKAAHAAYLKQAKNLDAMEDPTRFPPGGSWVRSRRGGGGEGSSRGPVFG
jgi:hypothetical protein